MSAQSLNPEPSPLKGNVVANEERTIAVFERAEAAIKLLRIIRNRVQKGKCIDPSEFMELDEIISSLRHNCEMYNQERLAR